jgi:F420-dependent oxidoreductase-like protein
LPGPDDPDIVGAQLDSLSEISGPDTPGTLGEETRNAMAKPLRIGSMLDVDKSLPDTVAQLQQLADAGFAHAFASQIFGPDALTLLAAAGAQVPGIELGTGVVPVYPRHPMMLAQQALTVQLVTGNRLILGIGLSHQVVVEGMWGISFEKPARYMKEYLAALMPLLHGEKVNVTGERVTANAFAPLDIHGVTAPPVLVAALGDTMLKLAGRVADGTVTWMTGTKTIESHIAPVIVAAAEKAGRPAPQIGVALPVSVTADVEAARERINKEFSIYPTLPSYKAMLDKEGATSPADVAFVGDEDAVTASIEKLAAAGATDFVGAIVGNRAERERTFSLLSAIARSG